MKSNTSFILAACVMAVCQAGGALSGEYYCPPGAKFCPAPGSDGGTAMMDNGYGMDDSAGFGLAAANPPPAQYAADPYAAQPAYAMAAEPRQDPRAASTGFVARPRNTVEPKSEVANQTASRKAKKENVANDEKVPWYKGGMWRNRKGDDTDNKKDKEKDKKASSSKSDSRSDSKADTRDSRSSGGGSASSSRSSSRLSDDDGMWDDDDEYSGYNSDGTFGRPAAPQTQSRQAQAQRPDPYDNPYDAPFGGPANNPPPRSAPPPAPAPAPVPSGGGYAPPAPPPQTYASNTYSDSYPSQQAEGTASFLSAPYSDPSYYNNAPTPDYGSTYSASPTGVDMSGYDFPSGSYSDPSASGGYAPPPPPAATSWQNNDPWGSSPAPAASPYQATPSFDAQGSPQFENAVRMVKENRFSEAKSILSSETSRNPSNAAAWRWLADCHYNLLELDDALTCYRHAIERDPNDYYALRGQGFAYLHRGHEYWRRMQEEVSRGQKEQAAATFAQAHENYKKSLESLGMCLRRAPNDGEAIYGEAMAAEGASRKLYSNAISYLKLGPGQRERAELFAENCITVINKGVECAKERARQNPGDAGPRALLGGLYLRKAILYHQLGKNDVALIELRNSRDVQRSILDEIDKNHPTAKKNLREVETYWEEWGGNR